MDPFTGVTKVDTKSLDESLCRVLSKRGYSRELRDRHHGPEFRGPF